ncbi:hypothetical protein GQ43DRAFT_459260 [Delitschia confertaspora ATCC 74209]|uniref:Microbial-type PARG catalytic domain-containing protein n=1 Tax=Delitschia confertaspora ATCC 74209 TaxID=1513339 RepID=A0A9P4JBT5_9PLEO|nr:hypothetical protein GQ43DRAFT_459260 [Delitschia confertaspora ATCC 74209]
MGRTEQSQGLAPPAIRKDIRSKQAKHIVNKVIPAILASNTRAKKGVDGSELIVDPQPVGRDGDGPNHVEQGGEKDVQFSKRKGQGKRRVRQEETEVQEINVPATKAKSKGKGKRKNREPENEIPAPPISAQKQKDDTAIPPAQTPIKVRIITTDTLTAAHTISFPNNMARPPKVNTCILNMASPLRPGGGTLNGATSQEEFLCARTTLLPSLKEEYYRLPDLGGVFTKDVLVFRSSGQLDGTENELGKEQRWWIDVISAGMLRFPDLEERVVGTKKDEDGKDIAIMEKVWSKKDRTMVEKKIKAVLRICCQKGVKKFVAGAWGCGAYGNPVAEAARAWRMVLLEERDDGKKRQGGGIKETWEGLQEVTFAIANRRMAEEFAACFGDGVVFEKGPVAEGQSEDEGEGDEVAEELKGKIQEMEGQIEKVWNADLKARLLAISKGLRSQLREREGDNDGGQQSDEESEDEISEARQQGNTSEEEASEEEDEEEY